MVSIVNKLSYIIFYTFIFDNLISLKIFDSKEADLRHSAFHIKPLFRGFSIDDPKKVICIHQAPEGNIQKFVQANSEWIKSHKVDFSSMEESSWI